MSEPAVDAPGASEDDVPSTDEDAPKADDTALAATTSWGATNWMLIGLFGALTLAGVAVTSGVYGTTVVAAPSDPPPGVVVPMFVYVYATLGALGYVFTKLMADVSEYDEARELGEIVEMLFRVPAAWILAAGIYLATAQGAANPAEDAHLFAMLAFLVGLYVNVAIKSLGSLADRMLGRTAAK